MRLLRLPLILIIASGLCFLSSLVLNRQSAMSLTAIATESSLQMESKAAEASIQLDSLLQAFGSNRSANVEEEFSRRQLALYLYKGDSLLYWNNARFPITTERPEILDSIGILKLSIGHFLYVKKQRSVYTALALRLIKPSYVLQNNYLSNDFLNWTSIPQGIQLQTDTLSSDTKVRLKNRTLFALKGNEEWYYRQDIDNASAGLWLAGFLLLGLAMLARFANGMSLSQWVVTAAFFGLLRWVMITWHFPDFLYRTGLYDVHTFGNAASFINSYLGDLLFNALSLAFLSLLSIKLHRGDTTTRQLTLLGVYTVLLGLVYTQFNQSVVSMVLNSTLGFDFLNVFGVSFSEWMALSILVVYSLSLVVVMAGLISLTGEFSRFKWLLPLSVFLVCVSQHILTGSSEIMNNDWLLLFALGHYLVSLAYPALGPLALGVQVIIMSLVSSAFLNYCINRNQTLELELLSLKLSEKQDAILENEFNGIPEKISRDEALRNQLLFLPGPEKEIEIKLKQSYFSGYFDRYDISFSLFDDNCHPLLPVKQAVLVDKGFFEEKILNHSDSISPNLFFVRDYTRNAQYIARIELGKHWLYVLMEPRQYEELGSFPDLLLDRSLQRQDKLRNLSWVVYRGNQSANRYGEFNYPYFLNDSLSIDQSGSAYTHYYFRPDESTVIILSQAEKSWRYYFTFNSYVLLFFSLFTYISYVFFTRFFAGQATVSSLTRRIQTIIIFLLFLAMSAVGITSGTLVTRQFKANNQKQLNEKTEVILGELNTHFKSSELFDNNQKELLNIKLKEYSRLFNTPISLFNAEGILYITSEPKLYELGLAARLANPVAYEQLTKNKASSRSVDEMAGTLNYSSLYTPLFGQGKQLIGFINLPYFAKQGDLAKELSSIISALINVYVILFVLSILAGLILSGYITAPLRLIKQQIAKIALGTQNEKISWQSNDEIGKLVSEYNQMLIKLEESANRLAQSERESAWREMAKQVAHEIKNPLTPMKLNLQYLQHVMKNNPDDFRERFEKASAGIIEQIDSLAAIASEFSNFAKLPEVQLQTIRLEEILNSAIMLADDHKNIHIINHTQGSSLPVKADREQCLRVFNNLIKNAVQALDETKEPVIEIGYSLLNDRIIVWVKDNGCGIDEALKPRLFTPNFTTKSSGSGLGLAMAKNSMQAFGGSIRFESEKNVGTVFFLEFQSASGT